MDLVLQYIEIFLFLSDILYKYNLHLRRNCLPVDIFFHHLQHNYPHIVLKEVLYIYLYSLYSLFVLVLVFHLLLYILAHNLLLIFVIILFVVILALFLLIRHHKGFLKNLVYLLNYLGFLYMLNMEDFLEELIQDEIIDETDAWFYDRQADAEAEKSVSERQKSRHAAPVKKVAVRQTIDLTAHLRDLKPDERAAGGAASPTETATTTASPIRERLPLEA